MWFLNCWEAWVGGVDGKAGCSWASELGEQADPGHGALAGLQPAPGSSRSNGCVPDLSRWDREMCKGPWSQPGACHFQGHSMRILDHPSCVFAKAP